MAGTAAAVVRLGDRALSGDLRADQQTLMDALDLGGNLTGAVGKGAKVLRITGGSGALDFVARVDGVLGTTQLVVANADLAYRLNEAVARGEQREVLAVLGEAAVSGALLKLGAAAEQAGEEGEGGEGAEAGSAAATGAPVVLRHATVDPRFVAALPVELRDSVEVLEGGGRTVQVRHAFDALGRARMWIAAGPDATAEDAAHHLAAIREVQDARSLRGGLRTLGEQAGVLFGGAYVPVPGTRAWDAAREIEKLTSMIAAERGASRPDRARIADLKQQLAEHRRTLAQRSTEQGGVIAAEDRRGRKRGEGPVRLDPAGQARAAEKVQRTDRALARSASATAEQTAAAGAAGHGLAVQAGLRPPRPAALDGWFGRVGRLPHEQRIAELDALVALGGRSARELDYLVWLRRSWVLRQEAEEAGGAVRAGGGEEANLRTLREAGAEEVREKSRPLIEVMRAKGPNYRDRSRIDFDEVTGREAWQARVARAVAEKTNPPTLDTDHLVALDRITKLDELVPVLRLYLAASRGVRAELYEHLKGLGDHEDNLRRMDGPANRSKNNRSWYEFSYDDAARYGYTPKQVNEMRALEDKALAALLRRIEKLRADYAPRVHGGAGR
ncbi:hypothetical protein ACFVVU_27655 [Kitasatospora sp. NPDC057965]|uniref:hypothetical protein n=1 Tax=Kitasatospora sp. NPDC057965 TaxID=3346291 RepID=UPI0036DB6473